MHRNDRNDGHDDELLSRFVLTILTTALLIISYVRFG